MKQECELVFPSFLQFQEDIKRYIEMRIGDKSVAEDLTSDLAVKLWDTCEKLPDVKNVKAWLFRIANNMIYDHYRSIAKINEQIGVKEQNNLESEETEMDEIITNCLLSLIPEVSETNQEALILSDVKGYKQKDIAEQLGISYSSVKMRVQRGRQQLKVLFKENCQAVCSQSLC